MEADDAAEADDAGTMDLELVHMLHDWAGVADARHAGAEKGIDVGHDDG